MKVFMSTIVFVLIAILAPEVKVTTAGAGKPMATATCFCKISYDNLTNQKNATGVCLDLTSTVNKTFTGLFPQNATNEGICSGLCSTAASPHTGSQSIAACACAAGKPTGTVVRAYSAVGTMKYQAAHTIGTLTNQPEVKKTTCTCPAGWVCNGCSPQVAGGVTTDGKCKKLACQAISITPFPANGTQLGSWGFTWGNALYAWGSSANGGAPNCVTTVISPALCKF